MGAVHAALDQRLGRDVAVKTARGVDPDDDARLVREARLTARLEHPGIVPVYDAGRAPDGRPRYAMRLVRGRPLAAVLAEAPDLDGRLRTLRQFLAVCDAVAYAHGEGVLHRDITPRNITIGDYGEALVVDWGLACGVDADGRGPAEVAGTRGFMAPEVAAGRPADRRSDVWSLGAVLHVILTGASPGAGDPGASGAPAELVAVAQRATVADPSARYPTARALAADLDAWFAGRRVAAYHTTPWRQARRLAWAWRAPLGVASVAALALASAVAIGTLRTVEERDRARVAEGAAVDARAEAEAALAASLVAQARGAEAEGARVVAEVLAAEALLLRADDPDARGVLVAAAGTPRPRRVSVSPLPGCRVATLAPGDDALACATATGVLWAHADTRVTLPGAVDALAFSGGGLAALADGTVWVWEPDGSRRTLGADLSASVLVAGGSDGGVLVGGRGRTWHAGPTSGAARLDTGCGRRGFVAAAAGPSGTRAFVCADGRQVRVEEAGGATLLPVPPDAGAVIAVAVDDLGGPGLVVGTADGLLLRRIDDRLVPIGRSPRGAASRVALRGGRLAVAAADGDVAVLDLDGDDPPRVLPGPALALAWRGPEALRVVAADAVSDWVVPIPAAPDRWDLGSGLASLTIGPGGELVTTHGDGRVVVRSPDAAAPERIVALHDSVAKDAAPAPDGARLAIGHAMRFDLAVLGPAGERQSLGDEKIRRVVWLDGDLLVAAPYAPGLRGWRMGAATLPLPLPGTTLVIDLEPDPAARVAAAVDRDGAVWWIDPAADPVATRRAHVPEGAVVAPWGDTAWVGAAGVVTGIGPDGAAVRRFPVGESALLDAAVDPSGRWLATGHLDGDVRLWSLSDGRLRATLRGHTARASAVAFSRDGGRLYSGSWDGTARAWDLDPLDADPRTLRDAVASDWDVDLEGALAAGRR